MSINIDVVYKKVQSIVNKNQNGILTPSEFNRYCSMAQVNVFNRYYGSPKAYQPEKGLPRINYGNTQRISESLEVFIQKKVPVSVITGSAIVPIDKSHFIDVSHNFTEDSISKTASLRRIEWMRLNSFINDPFDFPTDEYPIYIENSTSIDVFPDTITQVFMTYLRMPINPVWAYTVVSGVATYNPIGSIDFEWNSDEENNLIFEICSLAGVSFKDNEIVSYSENFKRGGDA